MSHQHPPAVDPAQARRIVEQIRDQLNVLSASGDGAADVSDRVRLGDIYLLIAAVTIALDAALDVVAGLGVDRSDVLDQILDQTSTYLAGGASDD